MILGGILFSGGIQFFFFPLIADFICFGPIIISAMYYDKKLILRTAFISWLCYSVLLWANVYFEFHSALMREYHAWQGIRLWSLPGEVLTNHQIPQTVSFFVTGLICNGITRRGHQFVKKQAQISAQVSAMDAELSAASGIQLSSLPETAYELSDRGIRARALIRPVKAVGGDFYDYFPMGSDLVFLVGDVSDKGLPAAMFMMKAKNAVRFAVQNDVRLEDALRRVNTALSVSADAAFASERLRIDALSGPDFTASVLEGVNGLLERNGCPESVRRETDVIVDEICTNIADYAYPEGSGRCTAEASAGENYLRLRFTDGGVPFNPLEKEPSDVSGPPTVGGLVIHLVRQLSDGISYAREDGSNCLTVWKLWKSDGENDARKRETREEDREQKTAAIPDRKPLADGGRI